MDESSLLPAPTPLVSRTSSRVVLQRAFPHAFRTGESSILPVPTTPRPVPLQGVSSGGLSPSFSLASVSPLGSASPANSSSISGGDGLGPKATPALLRLPCPGCSYVLLDPSHSSLLGTVRGLDCTTSSGHVFRVSHNRRIAAILSLDILRTFLLRPFTPSTNPPLGCRF